MKRTPWRDRIVAARQRGAFSPYEKTLAKSWTTCAVGEQRLLHPEVVNLLCLCGERTCFSGPSDSELYRLGDSEIGFGAAVIHDRIDAAEGFLDRIEDRVLELKREGGAA